MSGGYRFDCGEKIRKAYEKAFYDAGGGVWINKKTREQVFVKVLFYPLVDIMNGKIRSLVPYTELMIGVEKISREELERNYERLRR